MGVMRGARVIVGEQLWPSNGLEDDMTLERNLPPSEVKLIKVGFQILYHEIQCHDVLVLRDFNYRNQDIPCTPDPTLLDGGLQQDQALLR